MNFHYMKYFLITLFFGLTSFFTGVYIQIPSFTWESLVSPFGLVIGSVISLIYVSKYFTRREKELQEKLERIHKELLDGKDKVIAQKDEIIKSQRDQIDNLIKDLRDLSEIQKGLNDIKNKIQ